MASVDQLQISECTGFSLYTFTKAATQCKYDDYFLKFSLSVVDNDQNI